MAVTTPPAAPNRNDPGTFPTRADAFVAWLIAAVPEFNALSLMTTSGTFNVGSAASPSLTFTGDLDTGLFSAGANQIGFTAGGTQRVLLSTTAMQVDVPMTGTAVQANATDTTATRLLLPGAFGLGATGSVTALAAINTTTTAAGVHRYTTGATGTFPAGVTAANGGEIMLARGTAAQGFEFLQPDNADSLYLRRLATTWQAWQQLVAVPDAGVANGDTVYRVGGAWTTTPKGASNYTQSTAVATTSGTAFDFTGIPDWVTQIVITANAVSLSGTDNLLVQLGTSGGIVATGYDANSGTISGTNCSQTASTAGFIVVGTGAGFAQTFTMTITRMAAGSNLWIAAYSGSRTTATIHGGGSITLGAALDRVRLTRTGTDTFDAGSVNVSWIG